MKGERETDKGYVLWDGEVLTPPFAIRRVADKVLLNEKPIFPFPELPEEVEELLFEKIDADVTFVVEDKTQDAVNEAVEVAKGYDPFLSFDDQAHKMMKYLDDKDIKAVRTPEYGDLIVPVTDEWGLIVAPNIRARVRIGKEAEAFVTERPLPYEIAARFAEFFMGVLETGGMLTLDKGIFSITPPEAAEGELANVKEIGESKGSDKTKIEKMTTFMGLPKSSGKKMLDTIQRVDVKAKRGISRSNPRVVSFFPHLSWQKEAATTPTGSTTTAR